MICRQFGQAIDRPKPDTDNNKLVRAGRNPPSVLGGIPLSSQPEQVQDHYALFGLAPPGAAVSFQYQENSGYSPSPFTVRISLTGFLFCSVASRLRLIVANSGACSEGGVSSLHEGKVTRAPARYKYRRIDSI